MVALEYFPILRLEHFTLYCAVVNPHPNRVFNFYSTPQCLMNDKGGECWILSHQVLPKMFSIVSINATHIYVITCTTDKKVLEALILNP